MTMDYTKLGVPWLAALCYKYEKKDTILTIELDKLFTEDHIKILIRDRMKTAGRGIDTIESINEEEGKILEAITDKVKGQLGALSYLHQILKEAEAVKGKKPASGQPTTPSADEQLFQRLEKVAREIYREIESVDNNLAYHSNFMSWFRKAHPELKFWSWKRDNQNRQLLISLMESELNNARAIIVPMLGLDIDDSRIFHYFDGYSEGMLLTSSDVVKFARVIFEESAEEPAAPFRIIEKGLIRKGGAAPPKPEEIEKGWVNVDIERPNTYNPNSLSVLVRKRDPRIVPELVIGEKIPELRASVRAQNDFLKYEVEKEPNTDYRFAWYIKQFGVIRAAVGKDEELLHIGRETRNPDKPIPFNFRVGTAKLIVRIIRNKDRKMIAKNAIKVKLVKPAESQKTEGPIQIIADVNIIEPKNRRVSVRRGPSVSVLVDALRTSYNYLPPILHIGEKIPELEAEATLKNAANKITFEEIGYKFEWILRQEQRKLVGKALRMQQIHEGRKTNNPDNAILEMFKKGTAQLTVRVVRESDRATIGFQSMDVVLQRSLKKIESEERGLLKDISKIPRVRMNLINQGQVEQLRKVAKKAESSLHGSRSSKVGQAILGLARFVRSSARDRRTAQTGEALEEIEIERQQALGEGPDLDLRGMDSKLGQPTSPAGSEKDSARRLEDEIDDI